MKVKVEQTQEIDIEINEKQAFEILCETLRMEFVLDEDIKYFLKNGAVYGDDGEQKRLVDKRGNLFIALRNVAVNLCPNTYFRNDSYIYERD